MPKIVKPSEKRVAGTITLPVSVWIKVNEDCGETPVSRYLGDIVCEHIKEGELVNVGGN
ncbi:hypothetical protein [Methanosarcina mazei]|uniref:hypothetical protein n=1 Tax=Methanosarcina mazei TaxID=2209 RepID=UPI000AA5FC14|nr:hypothetical protein [Methanosarcina mazei]